MDRMIYTAMTGAKHILDQQATNSHNLANATSTGFRAQIDSFKAMAVNGESLATRTLVVDATIGADMSPGAIQSTGRDLDVAIQGKGWFAVTREDGSEAYTRNGSFKVNENGQLQTATGLSVQGDGGPISLPPDSLISIGKDGTVSAISAATPTAAPNVVGRLKLVNPEEATLRRADDGLFNSTDGEADADATVSVVQGSLEGSNVNVIEAMVNMISLARQFDSQMKLMQTAENNANKASQLFNLNT
jgi:flagellar basal-body rod protein FlgF